MKNSILKTAVLSLFVVFISLNAQAQQTPYAGKTFVIAATTQDIVKDEVNETHTVDFQLGEFSTQAESDAFVSTMLSYSGINSMNVSIADANGTRTGTVVIEQGISHRGLVKYLDAAGVEYMWVNDLKAPIDQYFAKRAEAKRNK
jgi:hypothetical protein